MDQRAAPAKRAPEQETPEYDRNEQQRIHLRKNAEADERARCVPRYGPSRLPPVQENAESGESKQMIENIIIDSRGEKHETGIHGNGHEKSGAIRKRALPVQGEQHAGNPRRYEENADGHGETGQLETEETRSLSEPPKIRNRHPEGRNEIVERRLIGFPAVVESGQRKMVGNVSHVLDVTVRIVSTNP